MKPLSHTLESLDQIYNSLQINGAKTMPPFLLMRGHNQNVLLRTLRKHVKKEEMLVNIPNVEKA